MQSESGGWSSQVVGENAFAAMLHLGVALLDKHHSSLWTQGCSTYLMNLHRRCGYSDSPFAMIYLYNAGSRNGV